MASSTWWATSTSGSTTRAAPSAAATTWTRATTAKAAPMPRRLMISRTTITRPGSAAAWILTAWSETRTVRRLIPLIAIFALLASGCGKKKEDEPIAVSPPPGAASSDELSIGIGQARGLNERLAPTSTRWRRVIVLDEKSALLVGDVAAEAITLITSDAGKTWRSLRAVREAWSSVNAALDGTFVVAAGGRDGSPSASTSTVA